MTDPRRQGQVDQALDFYHGRSPVPATLSGPGPEVPGDPNRERAVDQAMALYMRDEGHLSDEDLATRWVGQEKVTGPGIGGIGLRSKLALFGDTFEERQAVFQKTHPSGDYQEVPNTDIVLYRESPDQEWRNADPGFFQSWAEGYFANELGMDLTDFSGDLPEMVGEGVAMYLAKAPGGGRVVTNLFRMAVGAAAGSQAQQLSQYPVGTQRQTLGEQAMGDAAEAGFSLIGGTLGAGAGGALNVVNRRALMKELRPKAREAMTAAAEEGYPTIPMTQLSDSPFITRMGRQASSLWRGLARQSRKVEEHSSQLMNALVDRNARLKFLGEAEKATQSENRLIRETAESAVQYMRRHPRTRGTIMRERISDWWNGSSKEAVDNAYRVARSIEEPDFDLSSSVSRAREIKEGVWTPAIAEAKEEGTGLVNLFGEEITQEAAEQGTVRLDPISGQLESLVDDILKLDPSLPPETLAGDAVPFSKTDRIRELYKRARDLSLPQGGMKPTEAELKAGSLAHVLRESLENPTTESPVFRSAWAKANAMAQDRFATREHLAIVDIMRTDHPSEIVDNLIVNRRATIDNLIAVRKATDTETFENIRQEFIGALFTGERRVPGGMAKALDEMDPDVLNMLLPKTQRKAMRKAARQYQELSSTGVRQALERQTEVRPFIRSVLDNPDSGGIDALWKLALRQPGGFNSSFAHTIRAGILDEIIERSTVRGTAGGTSGAAGLLPEAAHFAETAGTFDRISGKKLDTTLKEFKEAGILRFLTPQQLRRVGNVELVQKLMDVSGTDAGTALVGATTIKGVSQMSIQALADMAHYLGASRLLMNDKAIRIVMGGPGGQRPHIDTTGIQLLGSMFSTLALETGTAERNIPEYNALIGKPQEAQQ